MEEKNAEENRAYLEMLRVAAGGIVIEKLSEFLC